MLRKMAIGGLALAAGGSFLGACAPSPSEVDASPEPREVAPPGNTPADGGGGEQDTGADPDTDRASESERSEGQHLGRLPSGDAVVTIDKVGDFTFDSGAVSTLRPDIFQSGHYSVFDVLAHLGDEGGIELDYHFDEGAGSHVIDSLDGESGWWPQAYYSSGWPEASVFRLDHYPYKPGTEIRFRRRPDSYVDGVYESFREEVARLSANGGRVVIPTLQIESPKRSWSFEDVEVVAHDVRPDVLQPGTITALDALLSLEDQGLLRSVGLKWYDRIGRADPVDSYWVERVEIAEAQGGCGFVYETGPRRFSGFGGSHIHIPADVRVTVSPEYALWFWICLGGGGEGGLLS